jgi:hypothetical protein
MSPTAGGNVTVIDGATNSVSLGCVIARVSLGSGPGRKVPAFIFGIESGERRGPTNDYQGGTRTRRRLQCAHGGGTIGTDTKPDRTRRLSDNCGRDYWPR